MTEMGQSEPAGHFTWKVIVRAHKHSHNRTEVVSY